MVCLVLQLNREHVSDLKAVRMNLIAYFAATSSVIIALFAAGTPQLSSNSVLIWVTVVLPHLGSCKSPTMLQTPHRNKKQCRIHATVNLSISAKAQQNTSTAQHQGYEEMNPNYFKWTQKVWSIAECITLSSFSIERKKLAYKCTS